MLVADLTRPDQPGTGVRAGAGGLAARVRCRPGRLGLIADGVVGVALRPALGGHSGHPAHRVELEPARSGQQGVRGREMTVRAVGVGALLKRAVTGHGGLGGEPADRVVRLRQGEGIGDGAPHFSRAGVVSERDRSAGGDHLRHVVLSAPSGLAAGLGGPGCCGAGSLIKVMPTLLLRVVTDFAWFLDA